MNVIRAKVSDGYWYFRGEREVSVGGSTARFDTSKRIYTGTTARSVRFFLESEGYVVADLVDTLRPDDVFYDVGAHIGFYTCLVSPVLEEGAVVAFEPDDRDRGVIRSNVARNHPDRISHHAVLLSDSNGEQPFRGESLADEEGELVDVWRLDDYRTEHDLPAPTAMKIDVEGAELRALEGARKSLESVRACYIELHADDLMGRFGDTKADLYSFLEEEGFSVVELGRRGGEAHLKAVKGEV